MTVEIACPHCRFVAKVAEDKIPAGARWATCPRCKNRFGFAFRIPAPAPPPPPPIDRTEGRGGSPWERRSEMGVWPGLYRTFNAVLFSPRRLFTTLTFRGGLKEPLAFGLLWGSMGTVFGVFWYLLMEPEILLSAEEGLFGSMLPGFVLVLAGVLLIPLLVVISMFVSAAILHGCLLLVRGGRNGFEATFRVVAYTQATQTLGVIPFIGWLAAWTWQSVVTVTGLREIHETSYGRVILACLLPFSLLALIVVAAVLIPLFVLS